MSITTVSSESDSVDYIDDLYFAACHTPVVGTFVSLYELFKKATLPNTYTGQIGEKYPSSSTRYFAVKTYSDILLTGIWGIGHIALAILGVKNRWDARALYNEALKKEPAEAIPLLKKAANDYRLTDAIFLLGTYYRDGNGVEQQPQLALAYFQEAAAQKDTRSIIAIGTLYLAGAGKGDEAIEQNLNLAKSYFHRASKGYSSLSMFATYREELVNFLLQEDLNQAEVLAFIRSSNHRYATDFPGKDESDLTMELGHAFREKKLSATDNRWFEAIQLFNLAASHLRHGHGKLRAEARYELARLTDNQDDYGMAALFGHPQAALKLSLLKKEASIEAQDQQQTDRLLSAAFYELAALQEDKVKSNFDISLLLGHYYLGLAAPNPRPEKALECYKNCLLSARSVVEKSNVLDLIGLATVLQEALLEAPQQYEKLMTTLKQDKQLWSYLPENGIPKLPLVVGNYFLKENPRLAQKCFDICVKQQDNGIKVAAYYGLSKIETAQGRANSQLNIECLEQCIRLEPNNYQTRIALYSALYETRGKEADDYLQPALDAGVADAWYVKGMAFYKKAEELNKEKQHAGFGDSQKKEKERKEQLNKALEFLVPAAKKGHIEAKKICDTQGWKV